MSAVKLRDFFEIQSNTTLSSDRKVQIFSNIKTNTQAISQTNSFSWLRNSWYFKTATTAAFAFMLTYLLYTPLSGPLLNDNGLLVARQGNVVQAWYVGTLLATEWQITIIRNGVTTITSQLQWGDSIYLYNTSKADFVLRDGSRGSIEWPAQLTIVDREGSGLTLTVDHARYIQIDKAEEDITDTTTHEDLTIETSTSRITTDKDDRVHLAIVTTQDRQFIQNKGDEVMIQSIVPNTDTTSPVKQQLASSHVAEVTDAVKVYTQVAAVYDELKTQSSSQTYDLIDDNLQDIDLRQLLTFDVALKNKLTTTIAQFSPTATTSSAVVFETNAQQSNSTTTIIALETWVDTTNSTTSLLALETSLISQKSVVQDEEIQNLSYQDTQAIDSILSESSKVNKNMPNDKSSILSNDLGKADVTITQSNITISNKQPLKTQQLRIIIKLWSCILSEELTILQQWFDIDTNLTLAQTIEIITSKRYITPVQTQTLTSLTLCSNNEQN